MKTLIISIFALIITTAAYSASVKPSMKISCISSSTKIIYNVLVAEGLHQNLYSDLILVNKVNGKSKRYKKACDSQNARVECKFGGLWRFGSERLVLGYVNDDLKVGDEIENSSSFPNFINERANRLTCIVNSL